MSEPTQPTQPSQTGQTASGAGRQPVVMDLPLLLEQLQGQIDDLLATVEAQQATTERYGARIAALERR